MAGEFGAALDGMKSTFSGPGAFSNPMAAVTTIAFSGIAAIRLFSTAARVAANAIPSTPVPTPVPSNLQGPFKKSIQGVQFSLLDENGFLLSAVTDNVDAYFDAVDAAVNNLEASYNDLKKHTDQVTGVSNDPTSDSPSFAAISSVSSANGSEKLCATANALVAILQEVEQFKQQWEQLLRDFAAALASLAALAGLVSSITNSIRDKLDRDKNAFRDAMKKLIAAAAAYAASKLLSGVCGKVVLDSAVSDLGKQKLNDFVSAKETEFDKAFDKIG